jgi:hypothetical protein
MGLPSHSGPFWPTYFSGRAGQNVQPFILFTMWTIGYELIVVLPFTVAWEKRLSYGLQLLPVGKKITKLLSVAVAPSLARGKEERGCYWWWGEETKKLEVPRGCSQLLACKCCRVAQIYFGPSIYNSSNCAPNWPWTFKFMQFYPH